MAFNFRPLNIEEILKKKKKYSAQASQILEYIKKNYDSEIVLDPTTDFKSVKIPRIVEDKENIAGIKRKLSIAKINLKGMSIQFGNGSGAGGSKIDAKTTAMQENATRVVCEHFIEKNKLPTNSIIENIYPEVDDDWHNTFSLQAKSLKKFLVGNKGYEYSRDEGIMPYIEDIALKKCGVRTKDSWNPADIYLVKKNAKNGVKKRVKEIGDLNIEKSQKLTALNDYMRSVFVTKDLVGVSLKKLKNIAKLEETNVKKISAIEEIEIVNNSIKLDLDLNDKQEFVTGEMSFQLNVKDHIVNVQIRAFSGGERESTQMDMTGSGEAAKLGKVSSREAIDPYISKFGLRRRMATVLPGIGRFTEGDIKKYVNEFNTIKNYIIGNSTIYFGKNDWETTFREAIIIEQENNRTASQLSSKLQCFQWVKILKKIQDARKLKDFMTVLYFGAKKQYDTAGPFLKIY
tara:strand:- start:10 stop:1386 length:1377 start_codon:yes stop_codon:yes gene_type:complete